MDESPLGIETLLESVGKELGTSDWVVLDQSRIDQFASCTGDDQWIHVDVERAELQSPYGSTIAHGYLTLALVAPAALKVWIRPLGVGTALNYGLDRVRFIAPVPAGSRVRNRVRLLAVEPKGTDRLLITTENTVEIDGSDKPALIAHALIMAVIAPEPLLDRRSARRPSPV